MTELQKKIIAIVLAIILTIAGAIYLSYKQKQGTDITPVVNVIGILGSNFVEEISETNAINIVTNSVNR